MDDIAAIDVIVPAPVVIEIVTGEKGDTGPPGPAGIPGPHAASHAAAGADALDVTTLAGYPASTATFLRGDHTFAVPPAGSVLPTAPLGQVLASQGAGLAPTFRREVLLLDPAGFGGGWLLRLETSGNFTIRRTDDAGVPQSPQVGIDPYSGGVYTVYGGFNALNGAMESKWLTLGAHTMSDHMLRSRDTLGNLVTISDSTTATPGAVITGGGAFNVLARWNGANWIVVSG